MYYPDEKEYITFVFSLLDEFAEKNKPLSARQTDDLLSKLLENQGQQKPLSVRGWASMTTFFELGVLLYNSQC